MRKLLKFRLQSRSFWCIVLGAIIITGYIIWNHIELGRNSGKIEMADQSEPISKLPNAISYEPMAYSIDSIMFKIDTGMPYSMITDETAKRYKLSSRKPVLSILTDVNGLFTARFGKARVDTIEFTNGMRLEGGEFILGGSKNFIGMDIIQNYVLVFERTSSASDSTNVYLLPHRPAKYPYKLEKLTYNGGYLRDYMSVRPYVNITFNGNSNWYFMDTQGLPFKMPLADSLLVRDQIISSGQFLVGGINKSTSLKQYIDFKYACTYKVNDKTSSHTNEGELIDYITKYAFNPANFFPFSVAIDFPNNAIYTQTPVTDFKLSTTIPK